MIIKRLIIPILLLLSIVVTSEAQTKKSARATIWELLEKNNPDAAHFMTVLYDLPTEVEFGNISMMVSDPIDFMEYVQDYSTIGILDDIGTAVHEACHGYESMKVLHYLAAGEIPFEYEDNYSVYFINSDEEYVVKHTETFPSSDFADEIPDKYKTLRYDTYINTRMEYLGTLQKGIYGLMDEWTAYYNGFKTTVLNFPEYERFASRKADRYLKYIEHAASHKLAYLEFKYYILHYLYHARNNDIGIYNGTIKNQQFIEAYHAVDKAYAEVIDKYESRILDIRDDVKSRSEYFSWDDESIWIGNNGIGTFSKQEEALKEAIRGIKYVKILEALSVKREG